MIAAMTVAGHMKIGKLHSIQALRGIAAFLVVLFHCAEIQREGLGVEREAERNLLSGFWDQGYAGVDLFFVISGFVMVWVSHKYTRQDIGKFVYNRVTRIYPLWWIFATIAGLYYLASYGQLAPPDRYGVENSVTYFVKSMFLIPQEGVPVLVVGWTLIHEVFFYLIFAVLLLFPKKNLPIYLLVWAALTLAGYFMGMAKPMASGFGSLAASLLTLEFIAGALLACILLKRNIKGGWFLLFGGAVLMALALVFYTDRSRDMLMWGRVVIYTVPVLAIISGLVSLERTGQLKINQWLSRLGDWSYVLYLAHVLVILTIKRINQFLDPYLPEALRFQAEGWIDNLAFWAICIVASVVFSALAHRTIEKQLLRLTRKIFV